MYGKCGVEWALGAPVDSTLGACWHRNWVALRAAPVAAQIYVVLAGAVRQAR